MARKGHDGHLRGANTRTLLALFVVVGGMVGLAYASVPLYKIFCQITGYGGTTQVAEAPVGEVVTGHPVNVRFDANVNQRLDWRFEPVGGPVVLSPGEEILVNYRATNLGETASTGTSTFNVTPVKAGPYFMKLECFCFTEQELEPGQSVLMPVRFFIDPDIARDADVVDVNEIILSYTFFEVLDQAGGGDVADKNG